MKSLGGRSFAVDLLAAQARTQTHSVSLDAGQAGGSWESASSLQG